MLGITLCLSIFMIITAIIRISAIRISKDSIDVTWEVFWSMVEACVAVTMVSLSVFRSFFVENTSGPKREQDDAYYRNKQKYNWRRKWTGIDTEETEGLPKIPRAMLTGMRTFIRGEKGPDQSVMLAEVLGESNDHNNGHSEETLTKT